MNNVIFLKNDEKIYTKQGVIHEHVTIVIIHVVLYAIMTPLLYTHMKINIFTKHKIGGQSTRKTRKKFCNTCTENI